MTIVASIHTDICVGSVEDKRLLVLHQQCSINARHDALAGGLLVTRCTVDLTGQKQVFDLPRLQMLVQLPRVDIIVFHAVAWSGGKA